MYLKRLNLKSEFPRGKMEETSIRKETEKTKYILFVQ